MDIRDILGDENEKPLDRLVADGGFVGIFRTICLSLPEITCWISA